jgi:hypothetical protein
MPQFLSAPERPRGNQDVPAPAVGGFPWTPGQIRSIDDNLQRRTHGETYLAVARMAPVNLTAQLTIAVLGRIRPHAGPAARAARDPRRKSSSSHTGRRGHGSQTRACQRGPHHAAAARSVAAKSPVLLRGPGLRDAGSVVSSSLGRHDKPGLPRVKYGRLELR